jgi:hypothetical protein
MTTHRHIQIHSLNYSLTVKAAQYRRCADNAARIKNDRAAAEYLRRAMKAEKAACHCAQRLGQPS